MAETRWEQWLYERHSKAALAGWAPTLRYFRYCRAVGGHANDGDQLVVLLRGSPVDPAPFRGAGTWVRAVGELVEISLSDPADVYEVTAETVARARVLEEFLDPTLVIDPPIEREHCVCPRYYPELFPAARP